jgi:hypothetical protein
MELTEVNWYKLDVERKLRIEEHFVEGSFFILDKATWKSLKDKNIRLLSREMKIGIDDVNRKK